MENNGRPELAPGRRGRAATPPVQGQIKDHHHHDDLQGQKKDHDDDDDDDDDDLLFVLAETTDRGSDPGQTCSSVDAVCAEACAVRHDRHG